MKRFITFIIAVVVLSSCLGITVFAKSDTVTFSDDFQKLYTEDGTYSPINISNLRQEYIYYSNREPMLNEKQKETVSDIELEANDKETLFRATINYKNGTQLIISYLLDEYHNVYNDVVSGNISTYIVDFTYPYENHAEVKKDALFGEKVTLSSKELHRCDYYNVYVENSAADISSFTGVLLIYKDNYYYADFNEIGYEKRKVYEFNPYDFDELDVHIITDTDALQAVRSSEEDFYNDDFGFFFDDSFAENISLVFIFLVFAIAPLALFIVALIFAIRNKGLYKKLYTAVLALSGCELVVFGIIFVVTYFSMK
ncbi:MAG: hypothetical protein E7384_01210 [Ruminococcaceae bacterium]|nr:hypothetical protein [Oscillospiraceae bacterium]